MAKVSEIFDQIRALTNDASDTQVPFATKKLYVNRGIALLWPGIWRVVTETIPLTTGVTEYAASAALADGYVLSCEISEDADGDNFDRFEAYELMPGDEDKAPALYIRDPRVVASSDFDLRFTYAAPPALVTAASYAAAQAENWTGPDRALNLPVLYAMYLIAGSKVDDRQDHTRASTTQAMNGVNDQDILAGSQFWLNQFYAELEALTRPLPPTRD